MSSATDWTGTRVRYLTANSKKDQYGRIVSDTNLGFARFLDVKMRGGREIRTIQLNNTTANPKDTARWRFKHKNEWIDFGY